MQEMNPSVQRQLVRWITAAIVAIVAAIFGQEHGLNRPSNIPTGPLPGQISGVARPIDGDSLYVGRDEVRLKGIDAPEGRQLCTRDGRQWDCGNAARDELRRLIGNWTLTCQVFERDKHGRLLAQCTASGRDINAGMVSSGMAVSYGGYLREQGDAKAARRGLWSSEFQQPREWRHERGIGM